MRLPDDLSPQAAADAADDLLERIRRTVAAADRWDVPVPTCPRWDVADLVGHVGGLTGMFAGLQQPDPPSGWTPPDGLNPIDVVTERSAAARRGWDHDRLLAELDQARQTWTGWLRTLPDLTAEVTGPTGRMSVAEFLAVRFFDLWHHLVDLRTALGQPVDLADDGLAARCCHAYVIDRVPWLYGKRAAAPEGAAVRLHLTGPWPVHATVAVVDGRAGWHEVATEDVISGPTAAFTLHMTGRLDDDRAAGEGLRASGTEAERLTATRMFG